jgi:hypothetical protein
MAIRSLSCFPNLLTPAYQSDDRDPLHANILRLIYNSRQEHATCALARGRYGLRDYGQLGTLLPKVPLPRLGEYLDAIDAVRGSHRRCRPCSLKFLAFCQLYTEGRLPERHAAYQREYQELLQQTDGSRDYLAEARSAIAKARRQPLPAITNVRWFRNSELDDLPV